MRSLEYRSPRVMGRLRVHGDAVSSSGEGTIIRRRHQRMSKPWRRWLGRPPARVRCTRRRCQAPQNLHGRSGMEQAGAGEQSPGLVGVSLGERQHRSAGQVRCQVLDPSRLLQLSPAATADLGTIQRGAADRAALHAVRSRDRTAGRSGADARPATRPHRRWPVRRAPPRSSRSSRCGLPRRPRRASPRLSPTRQRAR